MKNMLKTKKDSDEYREMAKVFRDAADSAEKVADATEKGNGEEIEEAMKDFMWKMVKMYKYSKT